MLHYKKQFSGKVYQGSDLLCFFTGTVLGPGFGEFGSFLSTGDGFDLLCFLTGTVFFVKSFLL